MRNRFPGYVNPRELYSRKLPPLREINKEVWDNNAFKRMLKDRALSGKDSKYAQTFSTNDFLSSFSYKTIFGGIDVSYLFFGAQGESVNKSTPPKLKAIKKFGKIAEKLMPYLPLADLVQNSKTPQEILLFLKNSNKNSGSNKIESFAEIMQYQLLRLCYLGQSSFFQELGIKNPLLITAFATKDTMYLENLEIVNNTYFNFSHFNSEEEINKYICNSQVNYGLTSVKLQNSENHEENYSLKVFNQKVYKEKDNGISEITFGFEDTKAEISLADKFQDKDLKECVDIFNDQLSSVNKLMINLNEPDPDSDEPSQSKKDK
ncbi:MAG: hypothetical protein QNJ31_07125 [Candidatus Caenarcaniphilales bacterium]|nr:hypothetical protein [Candidatus Caenarcaniphilales bacterium]